jgi:hypothetical protein
LDHIVNKLGYAIGVNVGFLEKSRFDSFLCRQSLFACMAGLLRDRLLFMGVGRCEEMIEGQIDLCSMYSCTLWFEQSWMSFNLYLFYFLAAEG